MRRGRVASRVAALVALVAISSRPAAADPSGADTPELDATVEIAVDGCRELSADSLRRLAAIEVEAVLRDRDRDPVGGELALSVSCRDQTVELTGGWSGAGERIRRRFPLAEVPASSRERYLALAVAEVAALVVAGGAAARLTFREPADWMPPGPVAPSSRHSRQPSTGEPPPSSAPRPTGSSIDTGPIPRFAGIGAIGRATFAPAARMQGAGIRISGLGMLSADAIFEYGRREAMLGHVSVLAGSVGVSLDLGRSWGRFRLAGGPGARLGVVRFTGVPADRSVVGSSFTGPTVGPFAAASARCAIIDRVELYAAGEAGAALIGIRSDVESNAAAEVRTTGPWLAVDLGARWGW